MKGDMTANFLFVLFGVKNDFLMDLENGPKTIRLRGWRKDEKMYMISKNRIIKIIIKS